jgi:putative oxidoreductase
MSISDLGLLALRLVVGLIFAAHGAQKAFGWWQGPGFDRWTQAMKAMKIQPAAFWAFVSTAAELVGGLAVAIGLFTPFFAALLVAQSVVIVIVAHLPKGFWNRGGGIEFPLTIGVGALAILGAGGGRVSLDALLGYAVSDAVRWVLLALALLAGLLVVALPRVVPASTTEPATQRR